MLVGSEGLPCNPFIKVLGSSTISGVITWLGRGIVPISFGNGFLFSAFSLVSLKIAHRIDSMLEAKKINIPIINGSIFFLVACGAPLAIIYQITPLNLMMGGYLILVSALSRQIFRTVTDWSPFL